MFELPNSAQNEPRPVFSLKHSCRLFFPNINFASSTVVLLRLVQELGQPPNPSAIPPFVFAHWKHHEWVAWWIAER